MADLVEYQSRIAARMERGASVDDVDADIIAGSPFSDDQRAALWLYAWSYVPVARQRYEARQMSVQLAARERSDPVFTGD